MRNWDILKEVEQRQKNAWIDYVSKHVKIGDRYYIVNGNYKIHDKNQDGKLYLIRKINSQKYPY